MIKKMKLIKLTPVVNGVELSPITLDINQLPEMSFWFDKGYTEISAPNLRESRVRIAENINEIIRFLDEPCKSVEIRSTLDILVKGNTDYKNRYIKRLQSC